MSRRTHNEIIGLMRDADSLERVIFNKIFKTLLLSTQNRKFNMPEEYREMKDGDLMEIRK